MVSIIGAILGILGSAVPEYLKIKKTKMDQEHEVRMFELQIQAQEKLAQYKLQEIEAQADIRESEALYKASEIKLTGWKIADGLIALYTSSVRPTITYLFFTFYGLAKLGQYHYITKVGTNASVTEIIWRLFTSEDMALFATIMGYWFGQRGMRYAFGRIDKGHGYNPY